MMDSAFIPVFQLPAIFWAAGIILVLGFIAARPYISSSILGFLAPYRSKIPGMKSAAIVTDLLFFVLLVVVLHIIM